MATIKTVAARAGVSIKTVSRVMNEPASVAEATRKRVLDAAEALNFVPDQRARAMRSGRSGVVGFLTDVIATTPYSVDIVRGVEDALAERGMSLLIGNTDNRPGGLPTHHALASAPAASRAWSSPRCITARPTSSARRMSAGVLVNCFAAPGEVPTVLPDDEEGGHVVGAPSPRPRPSPHRLSDAVAGRGGDPAAPRRAGARLRRGRRALP